MLRRMASSLTAATHKQLVRRRKAQLLPVFLGEETAKDVRATRQQDQAIDAALANFSVFLHLPTGAGKSLAFQLPALLAAPSKVTIVVSPLLALIHDQVAGLIRKGIQAVQVSASEKKKPLPELVKNKQLIYTTPEFLIQNSQMRDWIAQLYRANRLERLVIDEAHCVVQWGNSFRPVYLELGRWKTKHCATVPITLVSATVSEETIDTLAKLFNVTVQPFSRALVEHESSSDTSRQVDDHAKSTAARMLLVQEISDRPNLRLEISRKEDHLMACKAIVNRVGSEPSIVYCLTRAEAEQVCLELVRLGARAGVYHGGLSMRRRDFVQKQWMGGQISVICATSAFGMGIDRPDVRFVVHYSIPTGLTSYYQQIGRAGRDGKPSTCWLLFSEEDMARALALNSHADGQSAGNTRENVEQMTSFCEDTGCRREFVHTHFGYDFDATTCSHNCSCGSMLPLHLWVDADELEQLRNLESAASQQDRRKHQEDESKQKLKTRVEYLYHKTRAEAAWLGLKKRDALSRRAITNILEKQPASIEEMASLRGVGMAKAIAFFELFRRQNDGLEDEHLNENE